MQVTLSADVEFVLLELPLNTCPDICGTQNICCIAMFYSLRPQPCLDFKIILHVLN